MTKRCDCLRWRGGKENWGGMTGRDFKKKGDSFASGEIGKKGRKI